jgi:hypothetical protein
MSDFVSPDVRFGLPGEDLSLFCRNRARAIAEPSARGISRRCRDGHRARVARDAFVRWLPEVHANGRICSRSRAKRNSGLTEVLSKYGKRPTKAGRYSGDCRNHLDCYYARRRPYHPDCGQTSGEDPARNNFQCGERRRCWDHSHPA